MVYYIAGSNLFGQWLCEETVITDFRVFKAAKHDSRIDLSQAHLVQINWSYNIFKKDSIFYLTGAWDGKQHQFIKIPITEECIDSKIELCVVGNDYKLVQVGKNVNTLWMIDLKEKNSIKKINFHVEEPLEFSAKKQRIDKYITKTVITNDSYLYLTLEGSVYSGILPSYVDTRHCKGKVKDIQCGYEHFVLLTEEGKVYTWGNGRRLQLGHGDISNQDLPTEVDALAGIKIVKVCAGGWHTLALSIFGDVYAWGWNNIGQLGIKNINKKDQESYSVPMLIDLFDEHEEVVKNVKDIACGSQHSAILLDDNTVWTSGCNKYGQLGFSEEKWPSLNSFKKAFHCDTDCLLMCGPWNTVIYSQQHK